jgi:hypothetical protein
VIKKERINPLNVFGARRVDFCPPYFQSITVELTYNLLKALDDWIYENLSGRYYIGKSVELENDGPVKQKIKISFENPTEVSYFVLACPYLKYNK